MKKKTLKIISIGAAILVAVSILAVFLFGNNSCSNPNLATIDYSNTYATVSTVYQRKTFLYNGVFWLFYCNGTNLYYTNSADGLNWRPPTTMGEGLSASDMSVWFENGTVHYTSTGGLDVPVVYKIGQIVDNEIIWKSEQSIVQGTPTYEYYNAYSTIDSDGNPWVSFMRSENNFPESWYTEQVTRADASSAENWSPPMQVSNNSIIPMRPCLVPLSDAQMYAVSVSQNGVEGRVWNGTGWQTEETVTNRHPAHDYAYSAVSLNGEVHLTFVEKSTNSLYHYVRRANGQWQETLLSAEQDSVAAVLSADYQRNIIYSLAIQGNTLHVRKMENGVWADITIESLSLTSPQALSSFREVTDGKIGVALLEKVSDSPITYRLRYFVIKNL